MGNAPLVKYRERLEQALDQAARFVQMNGPGARQALGQLLAVDDFVNDTGAATFADGAHALG